MRFIIILSALLTSSMAFADKPEIFKTKVSANINRCIPHPEVKGAVECQNSQEATLQYIEVALDQCSEANAYGAVCSGRWSKMLSVDNETYQFLVIVNRYDANLPFKYIVSLRIIRQGTSEDVSVNDLYLSDTKLPFRTSTIGARTAHVGFSGGDLVMYTPRLEIGDGAKLDR